MNIKLYFLIIWLVCPIIAIAQPQKIIESESEFSNIVKEQEKKDSKFWSSNSTFSISNKLSSHMKEMNDLDKKKTVHLLYILKNLNNEDKDTRFQAWKSLENILEIVDLKTLKEIETNHSIVIDKELPKYLVRRNDEILKLNEVKDEMETSSNNEKNQEIKDYSKKVIDLISG